MTNDNRRARLSVIGTEYPNLIRTLSADRVMAILEQSENGDTRDLFCLYRDIISSDTQILSDFSTRKAAVLSDVISLMPFDKKVDADVAAKDLCWNLAGKPFFIQAIAHLLNAALFPVAVLEKVYAPGNTHFDLIDLIPVPYVLLDYSKGLPRIFDVDENGRVLPTSQEADPARYIIHRGHVMPTPDTWGGPMRALLFWWLLRTMNRQWWADFLERYGKPFLKGRYKNKEDRRVMEKAFRLAQKLGGIVVSSGTEVDIVQAANVSGEHFKSFIEICNLEISKLIVGMTLNTNVQATGLGSGTADLQSKVSSNLRLMDIQLLVETLRSQLFQQFCRINNNAGNAPVILFGSQSAEQTYATLELVKSLAAAGFEPDDDGEQTIAERIGFGIRRRSSPGFGFSVGHPYALAASPRPRHIPEPPDHIAARHAADLAAAFTGQFAPVAQIIRTSNSPDECLRRVTAFAQRLDPTQAGEIVAQAFAAYAAAGHNSAAL